MKTLNETFTDREFRELQKAKKKYNNGNTCTWRRFLLQVARGINGCDTRGDRKTYKTPNHPKWIETDYDISKKHAVGGKNGKRK